MSVLANIVGDVVQQETPPQPTQPTPTTQTQQPQPQPQQQVAPVQPTQQQNQVNFQTSQNTNPENNNSLHDFINNLKSDNITNENFDQNNTNHTNQFGQPNQQQQEQQQQQQQQQPANPEDQMLESIMGSRQTADLLKGVDLDKLNQALSSDEESVRLNGLADLSRQTSENAMRESIKAVMSVMPDIAQQIRNQVQNDFKETIAHNTEWDSFVSKYPAYGPFKNSMQGDLIKAIKLQKGDVQQAQANLAQMYSGYVSNPSSQQQRGNNNQPSDSKEFDLMDFMSRTG